MQLRVLGGVWLEHYGEVVHLGPAKQRCVLAAMMLTPGQAVSVSTLVDRVWGDAPPPQAANSLYSYVARLRAVMRSASAEIELRRSPHGYQLVVPQECVDLARYRLSVSRARTATTAPQRAEEFRQALALWHDEPLAGIDGEWAAVVREGLRTLHAGVLTEWADAELSLGKPEPVIETLTGAVDRYPYCEQLAEWLLVALARSGRNAQALVLYRQVRERLADDLGIDPGPRLRALMVRLLRGQLDDNPVRVA